MDWNDLGTALGLVLVIEGVMLALIPERLIQMAMVLMREPVHRLRWGGIAAAAIGLLVVWAIRG